MTLTLVHRVAAAIADSKGVEPVELDLAIADYIDVDALQQLQAHENGSWRLTFEIPEHTVTVTSDETIVVEAIQGEATSMLDPCTNETCE